LQFTIKPVVAPISSRRCSALLGIAASALSAGHSAAMADGAYITQATHASASMAQHATTQPLSGVVTPLAPRTPRSGAFFPTPEAATASAKSLNFARTLEIGHNNQVAQFQAGQSNISNVGLVGGSRNAVGVLQGGKDLSNLYLVNTHGLSVGIIQPKGAAPSNVLIARLPNGALLIKK
jgi:hypothetical protein